MKKKMWGASKKKKMVITLDRAKVFHEKYLVFAMKMHFPNGLFRKHYVFEIYLFFFLQTYAFCLPTIPINY